MLGWVQAVNRYQQLAALLRGEQPRSLLPPTPRGYVAARLRQLAASPVLAAFAWVHLSGSFSPLMPRSDTGALVQRALCYLHKCAALSYQLGRGFVSIKGCKVVLQPVSVPPTSRGRLVPQR